MKRYADMTAAERAAHDRIVRDLGKPDPRPHPLDLIFAAMARSGRALIVHEGEVLLEPSTVFDPETEQTGVVPMPRRAA